MTKYFVIRNLGVHVHLSKCWRGTWSEKAWEPLLTDALVVDDTPLKDLSNSCCGSLWSKPSIVSHAISRQWYFGILRCLIPALGGDDVIAPVVRYKRYIQECMQKYIQTAQDHTQDDTVAEFLLRAMERLLMSQTHVLPHSWKCCHGNRNF